MRYRRERPGTARPPRRLVRVLVRLVVALLVLLGAGAAWVGVVWATAVTDTTGEVAFDRPLAIPPLDEGRPGRHGERVFDLDLQRGTSDLGHGDATRTWGVNGSYLGPTLRVPRGERVRMQVTNDLGESSTLHWHGMHLPAAMDGGPHQMIAAGGTWSPTWRVDQPAGTLWYHPHLMGRTAEHVYRGLAGMILLDDPAADSLDLPDTYGVDDVPVIVQDRSFDGDQLDLGGSIVTATGLLGDEVLVNGTPGPYLDVSTALVRLRLLNASNARVYDFGLDDGSAMTMVAADGGLLPRPARTDRVRLSPGERADVVVALGPGSTTVLRSFPPDLGADFFFDRFSGGDDSFDVLELRAADTLRPSAAVPAVLADAPRIAESDAVRSRTFSLGDEQIDGRSMDLDRVDHTVRLGDVEIWTLTGDSGSPHSFHVHDLQFQVLDIDGREPGPMLAGTKDTVYVRPRTTMRLLVQFTDYADPDTPYMYHCHLLRHEDEGMMGQLVVVP